MPPSPHPDFSRGHSPVGGDPHILIDSDRMFEAFHLSLRQLLEVARGQPRAGTGCGITGHQPRVAHHHPGCQVHLLANDCQRDEERAHSDVPVPPAPQCPSRPTAALHPTPAAPQWVKQIPGEQPAVEPSVPPQPRTGAAWAIPGWLLDRHSPQPVFLFPTAHASFPHRTHVLVPVYSCLRGWPMRPQNAIPLVTDTDTVLAHRETTRLQKRSRCSPAHPASSLPASPLSTSLGHWPSCPASLGFGVQRAQGCKGPRRQGQGTGLRAQAGTFGHFS